MEFIQTYAKELVSLLVPMIAWLLNTFLKGKARLQMAQPHTFTFIVQQPLLNAQGQQISSTQTVHTRSLLVKNAGRESATKVELVFNLKPMCLNIWPPRHYVEYTEPDGRYVLIFDSLSPNEVVGCEVMGVNQSVPDLVTVRSDQALAQRVNMYPQPVLTRDARAALGMLVLLGLATAVYLAIVLLQFLILKTPLGR